VELDRLPQALPGQTWRAVNHHRVFAVDGNAYFNRSGPRLVDSAEILAALLHADRCARCLPDYRHAVRGITRDPRAVPW